MVDRQVGQEAGMPLDTPAPIAVTEGAEDQLRVLEGSVAVVDRDPDPVVSEAHDVRATVARQVGEEAGMLLDTPASIVVSEGAKDQLWCLKAFVAVVERGPDPVVSEAHDVRAAVARQISEEAGMPLDTPAPGDIAEAIIDNLLHRLEGTVAVVERDVDPVVSEAHDVRTTVARQISEEAGMPLDTPAPGDITEIFDNPLWCGDSL